MRITPSQQGGKLEEVSFEAYGPGNVAIIIDGITDNKNRTLGEIKQILNQNGGKLVGEGAIRWMFDRKGVITLPKQSKSEDEIMELVLDAGADDFQSEDQYYEVQTSLENFENVRKTLIDKRLTVENASLQWIAKNSIAVKGEDAEKVIKLIESLEDNDDVQNVYTNADFDLNSLK